jgi:hypothetical protein
MNSLSRRFEKTTSSFIWAVFAPEIGRGQRPVTPATTNDCRDPGGLTIL